MRYIISLVFILISIISIRHINKKYGIKKVEKLRKMSSLLVSIMIFFVGLFTLNDAGENAGFLVWDCASVVAGIFSFGLGTAAMQGAKAGVKGTLKGIGRKISAKATKTLGKAGFNKLLKEELKSSIDKQSLKLLKTCVFACFPAGTKIHTESGVVNIEDIKVGTRVWAYDEVSGKIALQQVSQVMQNETDHTIKLYTEVEVIETTALHPFMTTNGWKDASDLTIEDRLVTREKENIAINNIEYSYEPKKVYNFEVENWHTYLAGAWAWIVHNAERCINQLVSNIISKTPKKLIKENLAVDLSKFTKKLKGCQEYIADNGWKISKDLAGSNSHGGSYWKLIDSKGTRIATLDKSGNILRK